MEPEHAEKGAAGVQVPVDVLAHHLPRVLEHLRPRHRASQPAALARRVSGQVTVKRFYTVKKGYRFSRPQSGCHLPNSPWPGII